MLYVRNERERGELRGERQLRGAGEPMTVLRANAPGLRAAMHGAPLLSIAEAQARPGAHLRLAR